MNASRGPIRTTFSSKCETGALLSPDTVSHFPSDAIAISPLSRTMMYCSVGCDREKDQCAQGKKSRQRSSQVKSRRARLVRRAKVGCAIVSVVTRLCSEESHVWHLQWQHEEYLTRALCRVRLTACDLFGRERADNRGTLTRSDRRTSLISKLVDMALFLWIFIGHSSEINKFLTERQ